jgi:DNA-binding NtrC family response regulator
MAGRARDRQPDRPHWLADAGLCEVLAVVIEHVDDGVLVAGADGRILYHNAAIRDLFGLGDAAPLAAIEELGKFAWTRRGARKSADGEAPVRSPDRAQRFEEQIRVGGATRFLEVAVRRQPAGPGGRELRVVTIRDVTRRRRLEATLEEPRACGLITGNAEMLNLIERVKQVAATDAAVLLQGESGVGKSCFARLLHQHSRRADRPLIELHCASLPEPLMEPELFGRSGDALPAGPDRSGKLADAQGATLLLDEVEELPAHLQARLSTVLDPQATHACDCRLLSTAGSELRLAVNGGRFRADLYYRLAVIPLRIPPLRERIGDIPLLVKHFCDNALAKGQIAEVAISRDAWQALLSYPWPGNIHELANAVEHGIVCAEHGEITLASLPQDVRLYSAAASPALAPGELAPADADEQSALAAALRKAHGSKAVAAKLLGIDRTTLWRRMQRLRMS